MHNVQANGGAMDGGGVVGGGGAAPKEPGGIGKPLPIYIDCGIKDDIGTPSPLPRTGSKMAPD